MTPELEALRTQCGAFLKANNIKPNTLVGRKIIHAFWYGALCANDDRQNPWVTMCLLSGRHEELATVTNDVTKTA